MLRRDLFGWAAALSLGAVLSGAGPARGQTVGAPVRPPILPAYEMRQPTAVWDGQRYLVVFEAWPESQPELADLYLLRVGRDGALETPDPRPLGLTVGGVPQSPDLGVHRGSGTAMLGWVAKDGPFSNVAVAWLDGTSTATPAGGLRLPGGAGAVLRPSVAGADTGFLIAWAAIGPELQNVVRGQRFSADGVARDEAPERLRGISTGPESRPFVLGAGDRFWVTWDEVEGSDIDCFVTTVREQGPFRFQAPVQLTAGQVRQSGASIAPLGARFFTVWEEFNREVPDTYGVRLKDDLQIDRGPVIVTQTDGRTNLPVVVGDEDGALVVWQELREGRTRGVIEAGRIDTAGRVLEAAGFEVLSGDENVFEHAVAEGPEDEYLVVAIEDTPVSRLLFAVVDAELSAVPEPPPDAGVETPDTGNPRRDAGFVDAGAPDVGAPDDAAAAADAGARPPSRRDEGCRALPGELTGLGLGLWVGLALFRRRR